MIQMQQRLNSRKQPMLMKHSVILIKDKFMMLKEKREFNKMNKDKVTKEEEWIMISFLNNSLVEEEAEASEAEAAMEEEVVILEEIHLASSNKFTRISLKIQTYKNLTYKQCSSFTGERKFGLFCIMTYLKRKVRI